MKFFILHGTGGDPDGNWFPWLKQKLEEQGHDVVVPGFPGMEEQSLETWMDTFDQYRDEFSDDTVFIAHSVAPAFVLNLLEQGVEAEACFFVSEFTRLLGNKFDEPNKTIADREFDFEEIKVNCSYFKLYHGPDDPYVPMEKAENLAENLGAEVEVIEDGGHLNEPSGYTEFPKLLEAIETFSEDYSWTEEALFEAEKAMDNGELPIGAVVVSGGEEVSRAQSRTSREKITSEHAEIVAVRKAGNLWDKEKLTLYTTLQPCVMCLATAIRCGIDRVVYAMKAENEVSTEALPDLKKHGADIPEVTSGIREQESVKMFEQFKEEKKHHFARDYVRKLMKPYQHQGR
jgi:hypothetical protein